MELKEGWNSYYYPNGNLAAVGQVINGVKAGIWAIFEESGKFRCFRKEKPLTSFPNSFLYYPLTPMNNYSRNEMFEELALMSF